MSFLEYSNKTHSNIIPQEEFEELIHEVFNVISENLCKSLGPLGSSATILDGMMTDATKDGYSILLKYRFHNRYKKMIYNLIKAPCTKMNNTVGDGTTTAIALTNAMFNRYKLQKNAIETLYRLPRQFTKAWDEVIEDICKRIQEKATPISPDDYNMIYNIAYVTSNGNKDISENIAKVYRDAKSPSIKQKDSPTNKSYIEAIDGFDFPANLISDAFVRNEDLSAKENNIAVLIFDHKIETDFFKNVIIPINDVLRSKKQKLLLLAPYYDEYMCDTLFDQYVTMEIRQFGAINLIAAQFQLGKLDKHQLSDLSIILRSKIINQDIANGLVQEFGNVSADKIVDNIMNDESYAFYKFIGIADNALLTCNNGTIFKVKDIESDKRYIETLARAEKDLEDIIGKTDYEKQSFGEKIYDAKVRVMQLKMKSYIYYIGADSALQKNIIWDAVEDVIKCVRSAVKYGVVPGCQLTIISSCTDAIKDIIGDKSTKELENASDEDKLKVDIIYLISAAVADVYSQILHGPDGMGMVKLMPRWQFTTEEGIEDLHKEAVQKAENIIKKSIKENKVFDMETLKYNKNIITSAETDKMVLLAASELIKILISGNQAVFLDADVDASHQEEVQAYV